MKVMHIITGLGDGGAEAVLHRLIAHDPCNTHCVVSLGGEGKYGPLLRRLGVGVIALDMPRGHVTWSGLVKLWRALRVQKPRVVQTWMYHADFLGGLLAWLQRLPVVWGIHHSTHQVDCSNRRTLWVVRICAVLSRWVPGKIAVCAQAAVKAHGELGYASAPMVVIPNGYDLSRFAPNREERKRLRQAWDVADDVFVIGMVARLDPLKDHENLFGALALLSAAGLDFAVVLVGTGLDKQNTVLVDELDALGLRRRVRLMGAVDDIPAVMNALDVHVLSSSSEAFPNVLAEAMSCGTPCVATDVGDAALIVGETGWIVPPKDSKALAEALSVAWEARRNDGAWAKRQSQCRARIAEHFSVAVMVERYRDVWRSAVFATEKQ